MGLHGVYRNMQFFGDLPVRTAVALHHYHGPLLAGQTVDGLAQTPVDIAAFDILGQRVVLLLAELGDDVALLQHPAVVADIVQEVVFGHRIEVIAQADRHGQSAAQLPKPDEDVLHGVFGRPGLLDHPQRQRIEHAVVTLVNQRESLLVAASDPLEEFALVRGGPGNMKIFVHPYNGVWLCTNILHCSYPDKPGGCFFTIVPSFDSPFVHIDTPIGETGDQPHKKSPPRRTEGANRGAAQARRRPQDEAD